MNGVSPKSMVEGESSCIFKPPAWCPLGSVLPATWGGGIGRIGVLGRSHPPDSCPASPGLRHFEPHPHLHPKVQAHPGRLVENETPVKTKPVHLDCLPPLALPHPPASGQHQQTPATRPHIYIQLLLPSSPVPPLQKWRVESPPDTGNGIGQRVRDITDF